jgi:hypothetical protein
MIYLIILTLVLLAPFLLIAAGVAKFNLYDFENDVYGWSVHIFRIDGWTVVSFGHELDRPFFHIGNVDLIG